MISTCMNPFQRHQSESYIFGEAISMGNLTVNTGGVWVLLKDAVAATMKQKVNEHIRNHRKLGFWKKKLGC